MDRPVISAALGGRFAARYAEELRARTAAVARVAAALRAAALRGSEGEVRFRIHAEYLRRVDAAQAAALEEGVRWVDVADEVMAALERDGGVPGWW